MNLIRSFFIPSYQSNIPKFFIYRILYNFMLFLPVWVIYIQGKFDLSLTEVTFNDSAFWITMALTEIPTGAVADTWGRKQSQVIGMVIASGSILLFGLAPFYALVLVANSLWAIGITFISGADMAMFYDTLKVLDMENQYSKYRGRLQAAVLVSIAASGVLGGLIGEMNLSATFTITSFLMIISTGFLLMIKDPPRELDFQTGQNFSYLDSLRITFRTIRGHPTLRYALLYSSFIPLLVSAIEVTFIQPFAVNIGLPIASLGIIALGLRSPQFCGSLNTQRVIDRFGEWNWFWIAPMVIAVGVVLMGCLNSLTGIFFFALTGFADAITRPIIEKNILTQSPSSVRATILSVDSLLFRILLAIIGPTIGLVADRFNLSIAFITIGIGFWIGIMIVLLLWRHLRESASSS